MRPHERQIGAQVGKFLPAITRHLVDQRVLAVHHFIVGNRQHKALGPRVYQAETQLAVMMLAVDRVFFHVLQRIMHPAHVPLVVEAQTTLLRRFADTRPGRRFFGDDHGAWRFQRNNIVEVTEEVDGLQVLAAAKAIWHPLACLARVVAIQHRGHRIHTQTVDVVMLEPVQRRGQHETMHFGAPQVVDQRVPILMKAFLGVGVFVQRRAVELCQPVGIGREMRRHPV
ncbi:hypothetical protein ALP75_201800 [Pseudomonas syringae pv. actinidiae]|nr:hypothetical protein ALP75_201800 [Pseudomonas syringae pv. actinidiae]